MKLACEFITDLYGRESIAYHLIYLFAKLFPTSYGKASGLPAERSVNRETLNPGVHHSSAKCPCLCLVHRIPPDKSVYPREAKGKV